MTAFLQRLREVERLVTVLIERIRLLEDRVRVLEDRFRALGG